MHSYTHPLIHPPTPARVAAINASLRMYRPSYLHMWQLKTLWHEGRITTDDIDVHAFENIETSPAMVWDELDESTRIIGTVLILYSYCTHTVLILYSYTVLILYSYCTHTVLILCSYCTHTVLILYSYCPHTVLIYCTHTVLLLYSYCTHTVLILYSYCTHTPYAYTVLIHHTHTLCPHHSGRDEAPQG
jgi:hypothetical protein